MATYRYRNDHDTERSIADLNGQIVKPREEFNSEVELHNPLLTPLKPAGLVFSQRSFRWVTKKEAEAEEKALAEMSEPVTIEAASIPAESEQA